MLLRFKPRVILLLVAGEVDVVAGPFPGAGAAAGRAAGGAQRVVGVERVRRVRPAGAPPPLRALRAGRPALPGTRTTTTDTLRSQQTLALA